MKKSKYGEEAKIGGIGGNTIDRNRGKREYKGYWVKIGGNG